MMKDKLSKKIMTSFVVLRAKVYIYRNINCLVTQHKHKKLEDKRCKGSRHCVVAETLN